MVVVPCFDEERRLDPGALVELAGAGRLRLLLVDDGSTDRTLEVLTALQEQSDGIDVLALERNVGKGEAVRQGLLRAVESGAPIAGYYDADLATPPAELLRLLSVLEDTPTISFVLAARVGLLGWTIERSALRHYLGRVFATMASLILGIRVYDTQCGTKVFRVTPAAVEALREPFRSSWVFDVELIGRLLRGSETVEPLPLAAFREVPLREWRNAPDSKLGLSGMARAVRDLLAIGLELRAAGTRRGVAQEPPQEDASPATR